MEQEDWMNKQSLRCLLTLYMSGLKQLMWKWFPPTPSLIPSWSGVLLTSSRTLYWAQTISYKYCCVYALLNTWGLESYLRKCSQRQDSSQQVGWGSCDHSCRPPTELRSLPGHYYNALLSMSRELESVGISPGSYSLNLASYIANPVVTSSWGQARAVQNTRSLPQKLTVWWGWNRLITDGISDSP